MLTRIAALHNGAGSPAKRLWGWVKHPVNLSRTFLFHVPYGCTGPDDYWRRCTERSLWIRFRIDAWSFTDFGIRVAFGQNDYDYTWGLCLQLGFWLVRFSCADHGHFGLPHMLRTVMDQTRCVNGRRWEYLGTREALSKKNRA